tara:strand:- start:423 stop:1619 length:1197 start_codon:yes stop_codon:yes gene_type:complete
MKIIFKVLLLLIIFQSQSYSLNYYKYPDQNLDPQFCKKLYENLNNPNFPYSREDPIIVKADLLVEDIHSINGKDMDFEASFTLWAHWKDERIAQKLKDMDAFTSEGKPLYLCDFSPTQVIGETRKIFDPVVEFFNRKGKPNFQYGMQDWIEVFSDGTVQSRLRDKTKFKANFDFRRFPFDNQELSFELWSEFPSYMVEIVPDEPGMKDYKETLYSFGDQEDGIAIPGWDLISVDYENYSYVENDGYPYTGFMLYLNVQRQSAYYLFKIILPIVFILAISWSVFWVRGSQLEAKVNVTIVCLLSLIAYNFIIDEDLPKLSYLTFLDCFILISYFYTGIATMLCVYSFVRKLKSGRDLSVVDKYAQKAGPISYFGILIIIYIYFYNLDGVLALVAGPSLN